jgi:hypothetical protein
MPRARGGPQQGPRYTINAVPLSVTADHATFKVTVLENGHPPALPKDVGYWVEGIGDLPIIDQTGQNGELQTSPIALPHGVPQAKIKIRLTQVPNVEVNLQISTGQSSKKDGSAVKVVTEDNVKGNGKYWIDFSAFNEDNGRGQAVRLRFSASRPIKFRDISPGKVNRRARARYVVHTLPFTVDLPAEGAVYEFVIEQRKGKTELDYRVETYDVKDQFQLFGPKHFDVIKAEDPDNATILELLFEGCEGGGNTSEDRAQRMLLRAAWATFILGLVASSAMISYWGFLLVLVLAGLIGFLATSVPWAAKIANMTVVWPITTNNRWFIVMMFLILPLTGLLWLFTPPTPMPSQLEELMKAEQTEQSLLSKKERLEQSYSNLTDHREYATNAQRTPSARRNQILELTERYSSARWADRSFRRQIFWILVVCTIIYGFVSLRDEWASAKRTVQNRLAGKSEGTATQTTLKVAKAALPVAIGTFAATGGHLTRGTMWEVLKQFLANQAEKALPFMRARR